MDQLEREVEPQGISRRTIVQAAAWAVPVVAVASAAPMAAASTEPQWNPDGNGTTGSLNIAGNSITGFEYATYGLTPYPDAFRNVDIPALTVTWTRSGAWEPTPTMSLGTGSASDGLNVGSVITYQGLTWTVVSNNGTSISMTSAPTTVPGDREETRTPRVNISGSGDGSGGTAVFGVSLTGGASPVAGTHDVDVPAA